MPLAIEAWSDQIRAEVPRDFAGSHGDRKSRARGREAFARAFSAYGQRVPHRSDGRAGHGKEYVGRQACRRTTGATRRQCGIIAVDPSSPFTGGAILGDRVRMQGHATDAGIFIRSMATRGSLGGLAQATSDTALLLDAAGKEFVLVETVGVGQGEVEIVRFADCTLVVLVPGMGDDVQNLKAGLMEIADIFVLNKCDREGADRFEEQLRAILAIAPERGGWLPPVVRTIATENKGISELAREIERFRQHTSGPENRHAREIELWKQRLVELLEQRLIQRVTRAGIDEAVLASLAEKIANRETDPYSAVNEILAKAGIGESK